MQEDCEESSEGLTLRKFCKTENCLKTISNLKFGYITCELIRQLQSHICPKCSSVLSIKDLIFKQCHFKLKGHSKTRNLIFEEGNVKEKFVYKLANQDIEYLNISVCPYNSSKTNTNEFEEIPFSQMSCTEEETEDKIIESKEVLLDNTGNFKREKKKKKVFVRFFNSIEQIECESYNETFFLFKIWHQIKEIFYVKEHYQDFYYKGHQIYYVTEDEQFSIENYIDIIDCQNIETFIVTFDIQRIEAVESLEVPIRNFRAKTVFDALLDLSRIYDYTRLFKTKIEVFDSENQLLEISSKLDPSRHSKISINVLFPENPVNYYINYYLESDSFTFDEDITADTIKNQTALFFKKHVNSLEFYIGDQPLTNKTLKEIPIDENISIINPYLPEEVPLKKRKSIEEGLNFKLKCLACDLDWFVLPKYYGRFQIQAKCETCKNDLNPMSVYCRNSYLRIYTTQNEISEWQAYQNELNEVDILLFIPSWQLLYIEVVELIS